MKRSNGSVFLPPGASGSTSCSGVADGSARNSTSGFDTSPGLRVTTYAAAALTNSASTSPAAITIRPRRRLRSCGAIPV